MLLVPARFRPAPTVLVSGWFGRPNERLARVSLLTPNQHVRAAWAVPSRRGAIFGTHVRFRGERKKKTTKKKLIWRHLLAAPGHTLGPKKPVQRTEPGPLIT